jgi:hypothetical protein
MTSLPAIDPAPLSIDTDGAVRVGGTRVTLDTVVRAFRHSAAASSHRTNLNSGGSHS